MQFRKLFQKPFAVTTVNGTLAVFFAVVDNGRSISVVKFRLPESVDSFFGVIIGNRAFNAGWFRNLVEGKFKRKRIVAGSSHRQAKEKVRATSSRLI